MIGMRKMMMWVCALLVGVALTGCSKDDNGGDDGQDDTEVKTTKWADLAKKYPFLNDFPSYDKEIDMNTHNTTMGMESVAFFDYKCDKAEFATYSKKLEDAGFEGGPVMEGQLSSSYRKKTDKAELIVTMAYATGNLAVTLSNVPKN